MSFVNRKKRFKITLLAMIFMALFALLAVYRNMENLAITCIGGIMTILSVYVWGETKRPSDHEQPKNEPL